VVARTLEKAETTKEELLKAKPKKSKAGDNDGDTDSEQDLGVDLIAMECDLSSFASIRAFSAKLHEVMRSRGEISTSNSTLDVVCLNAGMCPPAKSPPQLINPRSTTSPSDGSEKEATPESESQQQKKYEISFATNHLGTFLLTQFIYDLITPEGGRIIITASSTHSMERKGYTPSFNDFAGAIQAKANKDASTVVTPNDEIVTLNGRDYEYMEAYAMSKLCNVTFTTELNRRLAKKQANSETKGSGIVVN
jgi:NAD(P)-dependent dehydrogenase (short-subunit alcohol dehydrogenase family)